MRWIAGFFFLFAPALHGAEQLHPEQSVSQLTDQLIDQVIEQRDFDVLDIRQIQHDVAVLSKLLTFITYPELEIHSRAVRALTYQVLNDVRYVRDIPENIQQIAIAMNDLAWTIPKLPEGKFRNEVLYRGGLLAQNSANQPELAAQYWRACAWSGHAGCLNIMADYSLSGRYGIERSVRNAVFFDQQVVKLGRAFHCAAGYSAVRLVASTYFWPDVVSQRNWRGWLDVVQEFTVPGGDLANAKNECGAFGVQTQSYVFKHKAGLDTNQQIELASRFIDNKAQKALLDWLQARGSVQAAMSAIPELPDPVLQCEAAWVMLLHSHFTHQSVPYRFALHKLISTDECDKNLMIKQLLAEQKLPPF